MDMKRVEELFLRLEKLLDAKINDSLDQVNESPEERLDRLQRMLDDLMIKVDTSNENTSISQEKKVEAIPHDRRLKIIEADLNLLFEITRTLEKEMNRINFLLK